MLPLAFKQSIWVMKAGEVYFFNCYTCKCEIDCFNFELNYKGKKINESCLFPICKKCYKK